MKDNNKKPTLAEQNYKNIVVIQLWRLLGIFVVGGLGGYLVYRSSVKSEKPNLLYLFVVWGVIFLVGLIVFIINILRAKKHLKNGTIIKQEELPEDKIG